MDQRQADRIIALLESIKSNTRGTEIQIDGIASDINKITSVIYDMKYETERLRQIAEDVNNIKHSITYLEWVVVLGGVGAVIGALWAIIEKFF